MVLQKCISFAKLEVTVQFSIDLIFSILLSQSAKTSNHDEDKEEEIGDLKFDIDNDDFAKFDDERIFPCLFLTSH